MGAAHTFTLILSLSLPLAGTGMPPAVTPMLPVTREDTVLLKDTVLLEDVTISVLPFRETYREATGGVFLAGSGDLELKHQLTANSLINLSPGVYMADGTYTTQRLVIRGVGSRTPYSSNRIRAYLDDIPLTTGDGISTVEDLDPSSLGTMEILKGPSSALYGSGLGGIVRLHTPYPRDNGLRFDLATEAGSFSTGRIVGTGSYKNDRWAVIAGAARSFTQGYRENSAYTRNNAFLSARFFTPAHTISATITLVDLFARIPSSLNEEDFTTEPWKAAANWKAVGGYEKYLKGMAGLKIESEPRTRWKNQLVLFTSLSDPYESRPFNILDDRSASTGFREVMEWDLSPVLLSAGAEYFHEWYRWQLYETLQGIQGRLISDHREVRKYANLFALVQWRPLSGVVIDGGINANLLQYSLETLFRSDSADQSGRYAYDPMVSPRLGISVRHHTDHYAYGSAGHGFSAPSLEETLLPEGMINTGLRPETGWNLEVGQRGSFMDARLEYDAALYVIFLRNMLVTERISEDIFTGANAGSARNTGLELSARYRMFREQDQVPWNLIMTFAFTLSGNRFTDFVDDGTDFSGNALPGIPSQQMNLLVTGVTGRFRLTLQTLYTGSQWMDDGNLNRAGDYYLFHLQGSWGLQPEGRSLGIELHGGVRNLFDRKYASMILVNAPSFGGNSPRYYYPGLPREVYGGIRLTWKGSRVTE